MKKILILLILSFFSTQGFSASCPDGSEPTKTVSDDGTYFEYKCPEVHEVFEALPCFFNGVKVGPSARLHDGVSGGRCCPSCSAYSKKRGTSLHMPRGTPIVAIADMKVISIYDNSADQKSGKSSNSLNKKHGEDHYQNETIMKPYDDIQMFFIDKKGNVILYYHMKETNLVKGFNKGNCKIPHEYQWGKKSNLPHNCGGYIEGLIKNNFWVKKGQVIGLSGQTGGGSGGPHISLGIAIPPDNEFRNYLIEMNKDNLTSELVRYPWSFTEDNMRYTAPQRDFRWENLPTNSDYYLFPVMSKKYLKDHGISYQDTCKGGFIKNDGICVGNGLITYRYKNGQIKLEENYKNGKPDGKLTQWYENGQIELETTFKDGIEHGINTQWHENGQIKSERSFTDDKPDGKWTSWFENGQIKSEGSYTDDKPDGKWTFWFENGQIKSEEGYKDGKKEGKFSTWHENGQIKSEENYINGKLDGEKTIWYEDGQIINDEIGLIMSSFSFDEIIQQ